MPQVFSEGVSEVMYQCMRPALGCFLSGSAEEKLHLGQAGHNLTPC